MPTTINGSGSADFHTALPVAEGGTGRATVLGVNHATLTSRVTFTGSDIYSGLQTSITPSSTSNKILVMVTADVASNGVGRVELKLKYGTTGGDNSGTQATGTSQVAQNASVSTANMISTSFNWLISPSSTSPIYLKVLLSKHDGGTGYMNYYSSSSITAQEILA